MIRARNCIRIFRINTGNYCTVSVNQLWSSGSAVGWDAVGRWFDPSTVVLSLRCCFTFFLPLGTTILNVKTQETTILSVRSLGSLVLKRRERRSLVLRLGGSSAKSLRPQPKKVGGWLMAIFEKKSIYLKK